MALYKSLELDNGVVINYHRVVSVNTITNVQNTIELASYTSEEKRQEEMEAIMDGNEYNVFIDTRLFVASYDQNMTVESAYAWLKNNVADFSDAQNC